MNPSRRMLCNVINHFQLACLSFRKFLFDFLLLHQSSAKVLSNTYTPFLVDFPVSRHCDTMTIQLDTEKKNFMNFFSVTLFMGRIFFLASLRHSTLLTKSTFRRYSTLMQNGKFIYVQLFLTIRISPPLTYYLYLFVPKCTYQHHFITTILIRPKAQLPLSCCMQLKMIQVTLGHYKYMLHSRWSYLS